MSASISGAGTSVTAVAGGVFVQADERTTLTATGIGASVALAGSPSGVSVAGSVGVGLASNSLVSAVTAAIEAAATVDAAGGVVVAANSGPVVADSVRMYAEAVAVAVSVAIANPEAGIGVGLAGAGSNAENVDTSVVVATIRGGATVTGATVRVTALDITRATSLSNGAAVVVAVGVGLAIGVAFATTNLSVVVDAAIENASVTTTGDVTVVAQAVEDADAYNLVLSISVAIGIAGAGASAIATVGGSTTARIDGAVVSAGAVTVVATTNARSHAKTEGGAGAIVSIAAMLATATTSLTTTARIGAGALVTASGAIVVQATRTGVTGKTESTLGEIFVGGAGFLTGVGGRSEATDNGAVRALVGDGLDVVAGGAMSVTATSTTITKATSNAGALAGGAIVVPTAYATHSADTVAAVGADTGVSAASLLVRAGADTTVRIDIFTLAIGLLGGAGADAQAQSSGLTEARVGPAFGVTPPATARRIVVTGDLSIRAEISQTVVADTIGVTVGGVGIGAITVRSFADGSTRAFIGNGTTVQAGSLTIAVSGIGGGTAIRSATANSTVGSVAGAGGSGSNSTSGVRGSLDAFIGSGARVTVVAAAAVSADGTATATADARGGAGGAIAIAPSSPLRPSPRSVPTRSAPGRGSAPTPPSRRPACA